MTTKAKSKKVKPGYSRHTGRPLPDRPAHRSQTEARPLPPDHPAASGVSRMMFRLGTMVKDSATALKGMLTHLHIDMSLTRAYRFQPYGLNPETGEPAKGLWIMPERIVRDAGPSMVEEPMLPFHLLGTELEDMGTGFAGIGTAVVLHQTGCVHITIQPKGRLKDGNAVEPHDFDIMRLKGPALMAVPAPVPEKKAEKKVDKPPGATEHEPFTI